MPCLRGFSRTRALPCRVRGPVDLLALARFAASMAGVIRGDLRRDTFASKTMNADRKRDLRFVCFQHCRLSIEKTSSESFFALNQQSAIPKQPLQSLNGPITRWPNRTISGWLNPSQSGKNLRRCIYQTSIGQGLLFVKWEIHGKCRAAGRNACPFRFASLRRRANGAQNG